MKYYLKILLLSIIYVNFCYSNSLNNFANNDIPLRFENELVTDLNDDDIYKSNKQKLVKMALSALFPGLGHFYAGNKNIGAIYSMIEIAGWMGRDRYLSRSKISSDKYKEYATQNWSLARWFKDYFSPDGKTEADTQDIIYWFTHKNGEEVPFRTPWGDFSHDIHYYDYNGDITSTKASTAESDYLEICETTKQDGYVCKATLDEIEGKIGPVAYDHHFFEGIGKYNLYFAGWNDKGYMGTVSGDIAYTDYKKHYENVLRANHKYNNNTANDFLAVLLINRAVSIVDVILRKNNKNVSVHTTSNYDIDNRYRINSVNLSFTIN